MVVQKAVIEEYDEQTKQAIEDVLWQQKENEKDLKKIKGQLRNIRGYSAERTIQEYNKAFKEKGLTPENKNDYPIEQYIQLSNLREFDAHVDPPTIKKTISNMIIEPVSIKEKGKLTTKYTLTINGKYRGSNHAGVEIQRGFSEGWYLKPNIQYMISNPSAPYDPETGKAMGDWRVRSPDKVHTLFVPEDIKERRSFLLKILEDSDTLPAELDGKLMYKQSDGSRGGGFTFDQFCELSLKQLAEVQKNAYYTDTRGNLRTKEGAIAEYNRANKKIEAIA